MSAISPEDLINDVKPWDASSWRSFLESYVGPIHVLSKTVARQFIGDPSSEVAKAVEDASKRVLDVARNVIGEIKVEYEAPIDPIESLRLLVENCANAFLGVGEAGKHALLSWTMRKITKEYLPILYPSLEDREKKAKAFEMLGIKEDMPLFVPAVKSPLAENLTLLGYPDYPSICCVEGWGDYVTLSALPSRELTLGGSLCRLIDCLVGVISRPGILSGIEISADVVKTYLERCPAIPTELYSGSWLDLNWKRSYAEFGELCKQRHYYPWYVEGFSIKCVRYLYPDGKYSSEQQSTNLLSFMRWLMPSLITGRTELLLSTDGRVMLTLRRII